MIKYLGKDLQFISWIKRDGSGTLPCNVGTWNKSDNTPKLDNMEYLNNDEFVLTSLSLSNETFIASGFNSFVVKIKNRK